MTFGELLKAEREAVGMSQPELAEAAGLSVQAVRAYEQETRMPTFAAAVRLVDALDADLWAFADSVRPAPLKRPRRSPPAK